MADLARHMGTMVHLDRVQSGRNHFGNRLVMIVEPRMGERAQPACLADCPNGLGDGHVRTRNERGLPFPQVSHKGFVHARDVSALYQDASKMRSPDIPIPGTGQYGLGLDGDAELPEPIQHGLESGFRPYNPEKSFD